MKPTVQPDIVPRRAAPRRFVVSRPGPGGWGRVAFFLAFVACLSGLPTPAGRAQQPVAAGNVDMSFAAGVGPIGTVSAIIAVPGSTQVLVAGGLKGVVRLNADNTLDPAFNPGNASPSNPDGPLDNSGANGLVNALAIQPTGDGGYTIIAGGNFTAFNGLPAPGIVRLLDDGTVDMTFTPGQGANGDVNALAVQSTGQIVVGGSFTRFDTQACGNLALIGMNGAVDPQHFPPGFVTGTNGAVYALAVQPSEDGTSNIDLILAGGSFTTFNGATCNEIIRLLHTGDVDPGFLPAQTAGAGANGTVNALVFSNDQILVGGGFSTFGGAACGGLARLNGADGSTDTTFNPMGAGANGSVIALSAPSAGGPILVGGSFTTFNTAACGNIVQLTAAGGVDTSFNTGGTGADGSIYAVAGLSDGSVLAGGTFANFNGVSSSGLARVGTSDTTDASVGLGAGANGSIYTVAVQADGKIIVGGEFTSFNGVTNNRIARLNADGSLDPGFNAGTGANDFVDSVAVQADGKIVVAGNFTLFNGAASNFITRLNADGSLDTNFDLDMGNGAGADSTIDATALQPDDGKILVGGFLGKFDGTASVGIARLLTDGNLDPAFNPGAGANNEVGALAIEPVSTAIAPAGYEILAGGSFTSFNNEPRNGIVRLFADGSVDDGSVNTASIFNNPPLGNVVVSGIAVQANGLIVLGGNFTVTGAAYSNLARLNPDGTLDPTFNPGTGTDQPVSDVTIQPDGRIVIVGAFTTVNGMPYNGIARLNAADGSVDTSFVPPTQGDGSVNTVALQSNAQILVGGNFTTLTKVRNPIVRTDPGGASNDALARLNTDGSVDTSFPLSTAVPVGVDALTIQANGQVIFGGTFSSFGGHPINAIARVNTDNSPDTNFNPQLLPGDTAQAVAVGSDGQGNAAVFIGYLPAATKGVRNPLIRCAAQQGTQDASYRAGTDGTTYAIVPLAGGQAVVAGAFSNIYHSDTTGAIDQTMPRTNIARLHGDGTIDKTYHAAGINGAIRAVSVATDGSMLIGGDFTMVNAMTYDHVAWLDPNGNLSSSAANAGFDPGTGPDGQVNAVAALAGNNLGKALVAGNFTQFNGTARANIVQLMGDGTVDPGFDPGSTVNGTVYSIAVQQNGQIVLGGLFTSTDGTSPRNIIRLNADGSPDNLFTPIVGPDNIVKVVQLQTVAGSSIVERPILGGSFSAVGNQQFRGAARLLSDNDTPPVVQSDAGTAAEGTTFSYQIVANHNPTAYGAQGLPTFLSLNASTGVISGTLTTAGTFKISLNAYNAAGKSSSPGTLTLTVTQVPPVVTAAATGTGYVGQSFTYQITASNYPTSYGVQGLPPGLTIAAGTGVISGTPTKPGTYTLTLNAVNGAGKGSANLTLTIVGPPVINSATTASGRVGAAFSYQITASGSPTSYGAQPLPTGLGVTTAGLISGTPNTAGTYSITLNAYNPAGEGSATLTLTVAAPLPPAPVITSAKTAGGQVGNPFSYQIVANGSPTSYGVQGLPAGLTVNSTTGLINGTPKTAGTYSLMLNAFNGGGKGSAALTLTVAKQQPPVITSATAAGGTVGVAFSYRITATNSPTSFGVQALPAFLSLNASTGVLTGTPTMSGTFSLTLNAANAAGKGSQALTLTILGPPVITSATTATGAVGAAFSYQIAATNQPTSYGVQGLPTGLSVNEASGVISGVPETVGVYSLTLNAYNAAGKGSATLTLTIHGPPTTNGFTPPRGPVGSTVTIDGNGFFGPVSVVFAGGKTAVNSVNATATAIQAAVPSGAVSGPIKVTTPYGSVTTAADFTITIPPKITSATTATGKVNTAFSYTIKADNVPTSFSTSALPAGLSVGATTGVISGTPTVAGVYSITLNAKNSAGTGSITLTLTIQGPPRISGFTPPRGPVGSTVTLEGSGFIPPLTVIFAGNVGAYKSVTSTEIKATVPSGAASGPIKVTTSYGTVSTAAFTITIPPEITSALTATGKVNTAFSYTIKADNVPTGFSTSPLPAGLTVGATTGVISGTPTVAGTHSITISARNSAGTDSKTLRLTINP